ncbi:MAG: hypothetical protein JO007_09620 [Alphaproteobacteria bacterium]|nr:hypothetical protein [Alphaproteobacteria bacterium]
MMLKTLASAVAVAGLLAMAGGMPAAQAQSATNNQEMTNGPQSSGMEQSSGWSAQQNIKQSERYHQLLEHNRGFRQARMREECGPITDAQLHQQCLQSFAEFSPFGQNTPTYATLGGSNYGSSNGPTNYGTSMGR